MTPTTAARSAAGGQGGPGVLQFVLHLLALFVYRLSCDFFGWRISPLFGVYGVDVKGLPFSPLHWLSLLAVLLVGLVYAIYVSRRMDLFDTGLALLFLASYVPVTAVWWISEGTGSYMAFVSIFWALVLMLTSAARRRPTATVGDPGLAQEGISLIYVMALLVMGGAILARFGLPTDFGFETAYARRREFIEWLPTGPIVYVFSWSVYVFCVYLLFVSRPVLYKIIAATFIALIFAASGDKVYVFIVPVLLFAHLVAKRNIWLVVPLVAAMGVIASAAFFHAGELWIPSLVQRLLFLPAAIGFHHIERFPEKLLYSYSFLSFIFKYDYHLIPSLLIGEEFYGDNDNATAKFTIDAYVNIGWIGLPALTFFFVWLRQVLAPGPHLILVIPLFLQLLDTPLPTALLTGGGMLMIATAYIVSSSKRTPKGRY